MDPSDQHDDQLELDPNLDLDIIMDIEVLFSNIFFVSFDDYLVVATIANGKKGMRVVTWMSMSLMMLKLLRWSLTHSKWILMMIATYSGL